MKAGDLTAEQAAQIMRVVQPTLNYLVRLQARMNEHGFPPHDPLLLIVDKARDAMHHLWVELHYLSCKSGVGQPSKIRP